jgi:hypothetical protein
MRVVCGLLLILAACGPNAPKPERKAEKGSAAPVKITQFYAADPLIPRGMSGKLCYGVENAAKVQIDPPVDELWPSPARCIDISPKRKTTYTLTAWGQDGSKATQAVSVSVGAPAPRIYDLSVNATQVRAGDPVVVCFKAENAKSLRAGPGHLDRDRNCLTDNPRKTTTYQIVALGGDNEQDSGTVTVHVK